MILFYFAEESRRLRLICRPFMRLSHPDHNLFIPDDASLVEALPRTTHLGIGAHQDDLEFMALHGILACFRRDDRWFGGVTCTAGSGSARSGAFLHCSDDEMKRVRAEEQTKAAAVGEYSFVAQLGHPSQAAKEDTQRRAMADDLEAILRKARPEIVYTHNPFDKHPTHVGVFLATLDALRRLPEAMRPRQVLGCEVWRGLDWLPDDLKTRLDVSHHPELAEALFGVFKSQISGGKRYDQAVEGRRRANATFFDSHAIDDAARIDYAIDLTPLIMDSTLSPKRFAASILQRLVISVTERLPE